jgi:hypothetical protein
MLSIQHFAWQKYWAIKRTVDYLDHLPTWQKIRRGFQAPIYRFADTGLLGLTPLKTHILICGFQAAGTTLLQLMLENGLPHARRFGRERSGWRAATYSFRNHATMISKQPRDIFRLEPLREFYSTRRAKLKIIAMQRDPRDLLTTQREKDGAVVYKGSPGDLRGNCMFFLNQRESGDTLIVRYEDLVTQPAVEQSRIEHFVGQSMLVPFEKFDSVHRPDFNTTTLQGLRPVETTRVARWKDPRHTERLKQMLRLMPDLPEMVVQLGYETDHAWAEQFTSPESPALS